MVQQQWVTLKRPPYRLPTLFNFRIPRPEVTRDESMAAGSQIWTAFTGYSNGQVWRRLNTLKLRYHKAPTRSRFSCFNSTQTNWLVHCVSYLIIPCKQPIPRGTDELCYPRCLGLNVVPNFKNIVQSCSHQGKSYRCRSEQPPSGQTLAWRTTRV